MRRAAWVVGGAAVVLGCAAGWIASTAPDGLERVAESLGFAGRSKAVATAAPSGLVGVALLFGFGVLFGRTLKRKK